MNLFAVPHYARLVIHEILQTRMTYIRMGLGKCPSSCFSGSVGLLFSQCLTFEASEVVDVVAKVPSYSQRLFHLQIGFTAGDTSRQNPRWN